MVMSKRLPAISRRTFLARSAGAGLVMGMGAVLPGCSREEVVAEVAKSGASTLFSPSVWFEISDQGAVLINIMRAEMGQHVGTALARIVADELGADWSQVSIKHVDTDPKWGYMVTGGSWSVHQSFTQMSQAGAAGRRVLVDAAAAMLDVSRGECKAINGEVIAGDKRISFADIIAKGDVSRTFTDEELAAMQVKLPADRDLIGKQVAALDIPAKSQGEATYGIDIEMPDMVFAQPVLPPTRYNSVVKNIDDTAAKEIPGYLQTLTVNDKTGFSDGWVLVIAETFPAAMLAAAKVSVEWEAGETAEVSEADLFAAGQTLADDASSGVLVVDDGDAPAARAAADKTLSATYRTSTLLHFTLEPQNALVHYKNGEFHIHAGNQWQSLILPYLATALDVDESKIEIHQYYLGGGFGRRLIGDQMIPAALASRELGRPVKLLLQRAQDSQIDCVRSPTVCRFDASFDSEGSLTGVEHAAAAGWPTKTMAPGFLAPAVAGEGKFDSFSISGADHWYDLPAHRVRAINNELAQKTFLPGWWRAVGPGWIGWGVECFMDELAEQASEDPVAFRLARLTGAGKNAGSAPNAVGGATRIAAALKDVAERSGWGRDMPANEALGVAVAHGQERNMPTWTACVAHVAVDPDSKAITVKKLWQSIDCGTVIHPDGAMAQAEGATLWGLSAALHEHTAFADGRVADTNLDTYSPLRMSDVPELDLKFMPSDAFPSGLGEPPFIAVAPAIGNAVYRATGQRARDLPIRI